MAVTIFALTLYCAVLVSCHAERSVLSTSVLFLAVGILSGHAGFGLVQLAPTDPVVKQFVEFALFSVLFTEGMRIDAGELRTAWRLPGRALVFGLPLTVVLTAALARLTGIGWTESLLVGAALSPTDPVFASALVGRDEVPARLRHLLNVESGLNDGLALPIVLVLIRTLSSKSPGVAEILFEILGGAALGIVLPVLASRIARLRIFGISPQYQALTGFAVGLLLLSLSAVTSTNEFLAAFTGGITLARVSPDATRAFHRFGELIAELLKLASIMILGTLLTGQFLADVGWLGVAFAILSLVAVRPLALSLALLRGGLSWQEWAAAAWFGPRGFATVFFSLLVLQAGVPGGERLYHLLGMVVVASIVAHSSTDVPVAQWFRRQGEAAEPAEYPAR
jgi:sodium/hydrogen antiporter